VRSVGSTPRYCGRKPATFNRNTDADRVHPIRSAITVEGIVGNSANSARISPSNTSTALPRGAREYFGGDSDASVISAVRLAIPSLVAIALVLVPSLLRRRRFSAQLSTVITPREPHVATSSLGNIGLVFTQQRHIGQSPANACCLVLQSGVSGHLPRGPSTSPNRITAYRRTREPAGIDHVESEFPIGR
jgi:hypothetical protein